MSREYTYVNIGDNYFCVQSGIPFLTWILLFRYKQLHLEALGISQRRVPQILKQLVRWRLSPRSHTADSVTLPVFAHLCLRVHRGHKLFNFRELSTTKIFDPGVDTAEAGRELQAVRHASRLDFTPSLSGSGPEDRWYSETYIAGARSSKTRIADPWPAFRETVVDQLRQMLESCPLQTLAPGAWPAQLEQRLNRILEHSRLDADLHNTTVDFVRDDLAALRSVDDTPLQLGFTHGDYSFVNFVYTGKTFCVIDWEGGGQRSLLHDLYNYFFTELYYRRTSQPLTDTVDAAIDLLLSRLQALPILPATGDLRSLYRHVYYLERIEMLLCRDANETRSRVLRRTLEVFREFERTSDDGKTRENNNVYQVQTI